MKGKLLGQIGQYTGRIVAAAGLGEVVRQPFQHGAKLFLPAVLLQDEAQWIQEEIGGKRRRLRRLTTKACRIGQSAFSRMLS